MKWFFRFANIISNIDLMMAKKILILPPIAWPHTVCLCTTMFQIEMLQKGYFFIIHLFIFFASFRWLWLLLSSWWVYDTIFGWILWEKASTDFPTNHFHLEINLKTAFQLIRENTPRFSFTPSYRTYVRCRSDSFRSMSSFRSLAKHLELSYTSFLILIFSFPQHLTENMGQQSRFFCGRKCRKIPLAVDSLVHTILPFWIITRVRNENR